MSRLGDLCITHCVHAQLSQSCLTLCDPMDCSRPGSSVHGLLQARILEWVAMPSSRGSSQPRIKPASPAVQVDSLPTEPPGKPTLYIRTSLVAQLVKRLFTMRETGVQSLDREDPLEKEMAIHSSTLLVF